MTLVRTIWRRWCWRTLGRWAEPPVEDLTARPARVSAEELKQALRAGRPPVLIDIRSPEAFADGHLLGATHAPLAKLARVAEALDRSAPTVVY